MLAVLRWIELVMPIQKRWYPVLHRYIQQIAGRVGGFGGNPDQIPPSPTGQVPGVPHRGPPELEDEITGKIEDATVIGVVPDDVYIVLGGSGRVHPE